MKDTVSGADTTEDIGHRRRRRIMADIRKGYRIIEDIQNRYRIIVDIHNGYRIIADTIAYSLDIEYMTACLVLFVDMQSRTLA